MDGLVVGTGSLVIPPEDNSEALDSHLKFTESGEGSWYIASGVQDEYYYDGDAMNSDDTSSGEEARLQTIVESDSSETIKFHWKVSCRNNYDYLRFYIDGTLKDSITGEQDWHQKSYTVSSGVSIKILLCEPSNNDRASNLKTILLLRILPEPIIAEH